MVFSLVKLHVMVKFSVAHFINVFEKWAVKITLSHYQTTDLEK